MGTTIGSEYLQWVKARKPARFNLAASGVSPSPMAELGAGIAEIEINGPSLYGFAPLQQAIATHSRVSVDCVVATSGTAMANFIAMAALINPGDEVLIEQPAYEPLIAAAKYLRAAIKPFPRSNGIRDVVSSHTRLIVVTNLHNPTCARFQEAELQGMADIARSVGARVLVDEVYLECMYEQMSSAFHLGREIVCTSSLTKAYGLGGLRCGWILAQPDLARRMWELKDLIDPSAPHPAEQLSVIAFHRLRRLADRAKALIDVNRALLARFMRSCPHIELTMPDFGTCVFPRLKSGNADRLSELLQDRYDTAVVPGRFFGMADHFRIGLGVENDMFAEGLERLRIALETRQ